MTHINDIESGVTRAVIRGGARGLALLGGVLERGEQRATALGGAIIAQQCEQELNTLLGDVKTPLIEGVFEPLKGTPAVGGLNAHSKVVQQMGASQIPKGKAPQMATSIKPKRAAPKKVVEEPPEEATSEEGDDTLQKSAPPIANHEPLA